MENKEAEEVNEGEEVQEVEKVREVEEVLMEISEDIMQGLQRVYEVVVKRNGMKNENRTIH